MELVLEIGVIVSDFVVSIFSGDEWIKLKL
jgi:hypothetical protein